MRGPDLLTDGWCLEDGEKRHAETPVTFLIPDETIRQNLQPGDFAKLIFRISLEGDDQPSSVIERMWVIVRTRTSSGYLGVLDNNPASISENDTLWSGVELPFEPRHVISVQPGDEYSRVQAAREPVRRWDVS